MSFHFKSVRIKDWLVYGGEATMDLPAFEEGRNIVVFNGKNGFGKTSLLRALRFVFQPRPNKAELRALWNEQAALSKVGSVEIALEFSHSGRACKIVRGANFEPWGDDVTIVPCVKLFIDGSEQLDQVEDKIAEILPTDCLEFIFFDGAEISRYAQKQHEAGVYDAIEKVLGIPAVRNLRDDLVKVVAELDAEQKQILSEATDAETLLAESESFNDEIGKHEARRSELVEKKQSLELIKAELEKEAESISAIERERQELKDKRRRKADLEERRNDLDGQIQSAVSHVPLAMLASPLKRVVEELRVQQQPSPRREGHESRLSVLRELIAKDSCVCMRAIDDDVRSSLMAEIERIEKLLNAFPKREATASSEFLELSSLLRSIEGAIGDPDAVFDRRASVNNQLEELETDIHKLEQELEGHELASVNELFQQIGQIKQQIDEHSENIRTTGDNWERAKSNLEQTQRKLDEIGAGNEQACGVTKTLDESRRLLAAVSELVSKLVETKRAGIQNEATAVFLQITNKAEEYESIRVNEDYSLEVVRRDGSVVENTKLSPGEKEVVAYSFITALNLSSVDPAPFVMDTPFGHLDSGHRHGLLRSLPNLRVQAVLLATDRDLPADERDAIDGSIAKEFTLIRDQRRATTRIEEN